MPSGRATIEALYARALTIKGQTFTRGNLSGVLVDAMIVGAPTFFPVPLYSGSALACRINLWRDGDQIIDAEDWCSLFEHNLPDGMSNAQLAAYLREKLLNFGVGL